MIVNYVEQFYLSERDFLHQNILFFWTMKYKLVDSLEYKESLIYTKGNYNNDSTLLTLGYRLILKLNYLIIFNNSNSNYICRNYNI